MSTGEENDLRQRKVQQEPDDEDTKKALETAMADPMVRTPAKPAGSTTVDEYWDLEDDENWVDGQSSQEGKPARTAEDLEAARKRRALKRDSFEVGVAFVVHLLIMCAYIYIHVYDATVFKRNKGAGYPGSNTYGGRWKFLTYINMWFQFVFFFMCFFTDIMPWSSAKYWFLRMCDILFTTIAFPLAVFVVLMFWGIYAVDQELVFPVEVERHIPRLLNHSMHTAPVVLVIIELLLVFHRYPSNLKAVMVVFAVSTAYIVWIVWVFTRATIWPYGFFKLIPLPALPVFFISCFLITLLFYFLGKWSCYLRWKERHDVLDEMGL